MATPNPTPSGSTGKFSGGYRAGAPAKTKAAKVAKPAQTPLDGLVKGTISAGQGALNTLLTPMYFVEDAVWRTIHNAKDPKVQAKVSQLQSSDPVGYLNWLGGQIAAVGEASTDWTRGKEVKHTGGAIAKELGLINPNTDPGAVAQNTAVGLAADILLDPTTYIPGGVILKFLKAGAKGTEALAKGAKIGFSEGLIPTATAAKRGVEASAEGISALREVPVSGATIKARNVLPSNASAKALAKQAEYEQKIAGTATKLVKPVESSASKLSDAVATGVEMSLNAVRGTLLSHNANKFLEKYAKKAKLATTGEAQIAEEIAQATAPVETKVAPPKPSEAKIVKPTESSAPFVDVAPAMAEPVTTLASKEIKVIEKVLKRTDKVAQGIKGVALSGTGTVQNVQKLIDARRAVGDDLLAAVPQNLKAQFEKYQEAPFQLLKNGSQSPSPQVRAVVKAISDKRVDGTRIGDMLNQNFFQMSNDMQQRILRQFHAVLRPGFAEETLTKRLGDIVKNKSDFNALIKAGAMKPGAISEPAVRKILDKMDSTSAGMPVTYANADELVAGLRAGDTIAAEDLLKIAKALDPDAPLVKEISKKMTPGSGAQLSNFLTTGSGIQTLAEMRKRVFLAKPSDFMTHTGLVGSDAISAYTDALMRGETSIITPSIFQFSRQASAERIARSMSSGDRTFLANMFRETFGERFTQAAELEAEAAGKDFVSVVGDYVVTNGAKKFTAEAILPNQMNQSFQTIIGAKIAGIGTYQTEKKFAESVVSHELISNDKMDRFVVAMLNADDAALTMYGSRMFVQKPMKPGVDNAALKHAVFLNLGDIVRIFRETDGTEQIRRAFFIAENGTVKTDSLDSVSMLQAVRQALENKELGKDIYGSVEDGTSLYAIAAEKQATVKLSKKYKGEIEQISKDFVDHLVNKALPELERIHLDRTRALAGDHLTRSLDIIPGAINMMKQAWAADLAGGFATAQAKFEHMQNLFARFAYMAELMRYEGGDVAEAAMKMASMTFTKNGKVVDDTGALLDEVYKLMPGVKDAERADWLEKLNTYQRHVNPDLAAPLGRERMPKPSKPVKDAVHKDYIEVRDKLQIHITETSKGLKTAADLKVWQKTAEKLTSQLQKERVRMYVNWMEPEHWSNVHGTWVSFRSFDREAELEWAKNNPPVLLEDGTAVKLGDAVVDAPSDLAEASKSATKAKKTKAETDAAMKSHNTEMAKAVVDDAAMLTLNKVPEIEASGLNEAEQASRLMQEFFDQQWAAIRPQTLVYDSVVQDAKRAKGALDRGVEQQGFLQRLGEKMSATAFRTETMPLYQAMTSALRRTNSDFAHLINLTLDAFPDQVKDFEAVSKAFTAAVTGDRAVMFEGLTEVEVAFQKQMNEIVDTIVRDASNASIEPSALKNAFSKYGLLEKNGFIAEGDMRSFFENLPFFNGEKSVDTGIADAVAQRRTAYIKGTSHAMNDLRKLFSAIQHAKMNQGMAKQLVANFGWQTRFGSIEAAKKAGWVDIKSATKSELMDAMPTAEEGALFHPELAKQIAAMDRQKELAFSGKQMPKIATAIMNLTSYIKFMQTSINPRHHVTNAVGDTSMSLMAGAINPMHWVSAFRLAGYANSVIWKSEYSKMRLPASMQRVFVNLATPEEYAKSLEEYTKTGKFGIPVVINGKKVVFDEQLAHAFSQRNVMTSSMYNDENLGMYEHMVEDLNNSGIQRSLGKTISDKAKFGIEKFMKPFGDFSAAYSNVPRVATAVHIMTSRSWKSEAEMMDAVVQAVNLYHPTIASLSEFERRYGRLAIGYYTWLRGAHSALADLIVNHTAATLAMPKLLSNIRQAQGISQMSVANPWGDESGNLPHNMQMQMYGPLWRNADNTLSGIQTSTPTMDVFQQMPLYYDPLLNTDQLAGANLAAIGHYVGGTGNPVARQIAQEMLGVDFQTGQTFTNRSTSAILDRFWATLGPSQLAKALGAWTPIDKTINPENRAMAGRKYFLGTKEFNVNEPGTQKAGAKYLADRLKQYQKNVNNQGK